MLQSHLAGTFFNRHAVITVEALHVAQPARQQEVKQRPQFAQVIFQRRAAQAQALAGIQLACGLGCLAGRILDVLRFIQDQDVQGQGGELFNVLGQQGVGGQQQVVVIQVGEMFLTSCAIKCLHSQLRGEVRGFIQPVRDQAGGHHDHAGPIKAPCVFFGEDVRQGLQGFAQAHVIREYPAHLELAQRLHPAQTFQLVGAQGRIQAFGRHAGEILDIAQALGEVADLLAAFPLQRQVFQRVEAYGVGLGQAQRGGAGFLQVKLAEGCQHRLQAAVGQRHLQRAVAVGQAGDVHQDQLFIAAPRQFLRVEDLGMRAHQVQQDRQQAQAFAVDDDAQLQIEPIAFRPFIDCGIPVIDGAQVKAEVFIDLQFPALGTQGRRHIEGEVQPGTVIDHLEQLAGTFRQGLALARGDLEAKQAQVFAIGLLLLGLALDPQALRLLAHNDVGIFLPADIVAQVVERQRRTVLDIALHLAVARLERAEFHAGQPQAWHRLHVVHHHLWQDNAVIEHGLEFFQQLRILGRCRVGQGFLNLEQHRRDVFAVGVHRARAAAVHQDQQALGRFAQ
ncbi:hypothetical protein PFLmoz3_03505 [Pseudomonas fluorescens]|uniref:Uncharacterized protein n=1 Tax=Pseudomonas fluorescens TaxID=294 RepID=A0A109LFN7_PSEFL|nr:hypothetical protein PFLmoz3_03505 [Pseudomonas fluorescens]